MSIPEEIGRNIIFLRSISKVSREWLAMEAKISDSHLYEIEHGKANPTVEILAKIANALDVPFETLFVSDLPSQFAPLVAAEEYCGRAVTIPEILFLYRALDLFRQGKLKLEE